MLIDAHNHLQDSRLDDSRERIISTMKTAGIVGSVVNGTSESDWPKVQTLAETHPGFIHPSYGLHPWKIASRSSDWLALLRSFLKDNPQASVGECGLDRWMRDPYFEEQQIAFRSQLDLAIELSRPVTIHCLKAWGPLMDILREMPTLPPVLFHSFNGSLEIAQELTHMGAYFSFSGYFLHERKKSQLELFRQLPADRILVESDAPEMHPPSQFIKNPFDEFNHPANLSEISSSFSEVTQVKQAQILSNTKSLFNLS